MTLAARLGHADPAFTARTYIHGDDDRARAFADLADTLRCATGSTYPNRSRQNNGGRAPMRATPVPL